MNKRKNYKKNLNLILKIDYNIKTTILYKITKINFQIIFKIQKLLWKFKLNFR
jgi:hypothetical protein